MRVDFNPRTPCGVRQDNRKIAGRKCHFNPRTPCGVRHDAAVHPVYNVKFQSTHPLRGATLLRGLRRVPARISIHAPLAGCDEISTFCYDEKNISIHAPLAGCDYSENTEISENGNFNPRTPCGVRQCVGYSLSGSIRISIHAPLAGCDLRPKRKLITKRISIHAPLAGCD